MSTRTFSDAELVEQTKDGLISGFEELVRKYQPRCKRFAMGMLSNREEAEEAVQDAFVRAYANIDKFRGDSKFSTWLYKILYNLCYTRLRYRKSFVDISVVEDRYEDRLLQQSIVSEATSQIEIKDLADKVKKVLHELPGRYRTVMDLFYIEDMTIGEIAEITRISNNSVKVRLYRGRTLLRDMVYKRFGQKGTL